MSNNEPLLVQLLASVREGEIATCDECGGYALTKHMHIYEGSMGKTTSSCPECDLPPMWQSKFSKDPSRNHRRYYVHFDPRTPETQRVQWGHPTKGNPLEIVDDKGESLCRKRKQPTGLVVMKRGG